MNKYVDLYFYDGAGREEKGYSPDSYSLYSKTHFLTFYYSLIVRLGVHFLFLMLCQNEIVASRET